MKAPMSQEVSEALKSKISASDFVSQVIKSIDSPSGATVHFGNTTRVYKPASSVQRRSSK